MTDTEDAASEAAAPKRGGRRTQVPDIEQLAEKLADVRRVRQARVRHDAAPAPVDGDYDPLRLTNTHPAWEYFWASDRDRSRLGGRGWIEEKWGPASARPAFYYGAQTRGNAIRFNELTLMKLPKDVAALIREQDPKRRQHTALMREVLTPSLPNHRATLTEQTLSGDMTRS